MGEQFTAEELETVRRFLTAITEIQRTHVLALREREPSRDDCLPGDRGAAGVHERSGARS